MNKLILAAITAPLIFGGMQTSAIAATSGSCSGDTSSVSCTSFTPGDTVDDLAVIATSSVNLADVFSTYGSSFSPVLQNIYDNYHNEASFETNQWNLGGYGVASTPVAINDSRVTSTSSYSSAYFYAMFQNGIATIYGIASGQSSIQWVSLRGVKHSESGEFTGEVASVGQYNAVQAVPGPEAGAGLGALALGGMALYMKRRRKEEAAAG